MPAIMTDYQTLLLEYTPRPITSEREYRRALKYVEANMEPHLPKAKALFFSDSRHAWQIGTKPAAPQRVCRQSHGCSADAKR